MERILFVCSGNKLRSPTAEIVFRNKGFDTKSGGTSRNAKKCVSINMIKWAELIVFMEKKHYQKIMSYFPIAMKYKKIKILNIKDEYKFLDQKLVERLEKINLLSE